MERLIIKRQISYSCLFPDEQHNLVELLKTIPSKSSIAWLSYLLIKKDNATIDQSELDFFMPLLFKMNKSLQHTFSEYLQHISEDLDSYVFIDRVTLLLLIEYIIVNHNDIDIDVSESREDFSNLIIAYLLCCDEKLNTAPNDHQRIKDAKSQMEVHLPEQLKINDIFYSKDYRVEFIRFYYFMFFCEEDHQFGDYLQLFLQENRAEGWEEYLHFVFYVYLRNSTNEEGITNLIKINPDTYYGKKFLDSMCIDIKKFKKTADFTGLRSKPIYYHGNNLYSIISSKFFVDKMFQSFLFDLALVIKKNGDKQIKGYPQLKQLVGERYTERYLFYEIIRGCFSNSCKKLVSGDELKKHLRDGEPDFYIRMGKNIFLFEFKDVMLPAKTKHCGNLEHIKHELLQTFELTTVERSSGKQKNKPAPKGITQLLNVIEKKLNIIIQKVDRFEVIDRLNIYPIIVYQDPSFDIEGVRYILKNRFEELKLTRDIPVDYCVKECVMMPLSILIKLEDCFNDGRLMLNKLIDDYIVECGRSEQNKLLPFNKFIMAEAYKKGYKNEMSLRFKRISEETFRK